MSLTPWWKSCCRDNMTISLTWDVSHLVGLSYLRTSISHQFYSIHKSEKFKWRQNSLRFNFLSYSMLICSRTSFNWLVWPESNQFSKLFLNWFTKSIIICQLLQSQSFYCTSLIVSKNTCLIQWRKMQLA